MTDPTGGERRDVSIPRRASLELLRAEAADELAVVIHERLLAGEDPWDFMDDLPSIDELVVLCLRAENIAANGGVRPNASRHYRVLREIALEYPALTPTVWHLLGDAKAYRRWDAVPRPTRPDGIPRPGTRKRPQPGGHGRLENRVS